MSKTVYILSGSNLGDREYNLNKALDKIGQIPGLEITATSGIYVSDAVDMKGENPSFLNQAIMAEYEYIPLELLDTLETIERSMGRTGKKQMKAREIDLDILLFGDEVVSDDRLVIPHRKLIKRHFALIPLLQITPELEHPVFKKPLSSYLKESDYKKVILYKDHVARNI